MNKEKCYCCKKVKEGTYILINNVISRKDSIIKKNNLRWVCHDCNYLESENKQSN